MVFFDWKNMIENEIIQLEEEGKDIGFLTSHKNIYTKEVYVDLYNETINLPIREDFPYEEPSELNDIKAESEGWSDNHTFIPKELPNEITLLDKIYGAWLARASGCFLGKPVEGWEHNEIKDLLLENNAYPLDYYFSARFKPNLKEDWKNTNYPESVIEHCKGMPRDDDLDYTILALKTVEKYGVNFEAKDVGDMWLSYLPPLMTYTAELSAYSNLCIGLKVPDTASHHNPYREWIGAQIRTDLYGYIYPGDPESAVELAYQDASLSHTANGIYGAMFVAALNALSFTESNMKELILSALKYIPTKSRFYEAVTWVIEQVEQGHNETIVGKKLLERFHSYNRVHTINNVAIVVYALLYGKNELEKTLTLAVGLGLDTDCNGATAGSIIGIINGAKELPEKWIKPLHNQIESYVAGEGTQEINSLADRTFNLIQKRE